MINFSELDRLNEAEKELALKILKEYEKNGYSDIYNKLLLEDYKENPVDIITFIEDNKYLGNAWHTSDGKSKLFPFWIEQLKKLFPDPFTTNYNNFIESGARGIGKSEIAVTCILYILYRTMCLKNPRQFYNLKPTEKICFAFMNITEALAYDIGVSKFQSTIQMSPWFLERGTITGTKDLVWNPPDYINIIVGSQPRHVIGQAILAAFFDEISFIANQDIEKQKEKALDMIDTALGGMRTRFLNNGKSPSLLILASSKRSEKSFLETHMKKKAETEGDSTLIVDEPVWNIRPKSEYSGLTFKLALGNKFLVSEVLNDDADLNAWRLKGYKILDVPIEYKVAFVENIDRALCDYAGISSSEVSKYLAGDRISCIINNELKNPFVKDILEIGNARDDTRQYYDFFDLDRVPKNMMSMPLYIHLDMSISGDKTGIVGTWIKGKKPSAESTSKELYYQLAFNVSIKAPKGHQVSFAKNKQFIYWLKEQGFNIKGVSSDTFQNAAIAQDLIDKGYQYSVISVDRCNSDKICEPYAYLKNVIYEQRLTMYYSELLVEELTGLERNGNTGKIDHPDGGRYGSKDAADGLCGGMWNASKHSEEFNFYYGEDLELMVDVSSAKSQVSQKQIELDMQEQLNKIFDPIQKKKAALDKQPFTDFGLGAASTNYSALYLANGIVL